VSKKVLVLGGSGMLGSMVADYLSRDPELAVSATTRDAEAAAACRGRLGSVEWLTLDAARPDEADGARLVEGFDWVVNCVGIIKPLIHDDNAAEVERAVRVNALFPHALARRAEAAGARVLQIATDCVYDGSKGRYREGDAHDPVDVYGKTKSLGEVYSPAVHHLRCSIIGPEWKEPKSLMEWFLGQPQGARVNGFTNHSWNGVTTLHYAKLCAGLIKSDLKLRHAQHVVPAGEVTKHELLGLFARWFGREDVEINPTEAGVVIDRTLSTSNEELNRELWAAAGYGEPPTVARMLEELARFDYRMGARG
jgi:dTDP-4-dehydrorhamnose reductase